MNLLPISRYLFHESSRGQIIRSKILSRTFCFDHLKPPTQNIFLLKNFSVSSTQLDRYPVPQEGRRKVRVSNSLSCVPQKSAEKEQLLLMNKDVATWYTCGPTVYDSAHLGHASSYVRFDVLRRILAEFFSTSVVMVMGLTDIDDKIIQRTLESGASDFREISRHFEEEFYRDMQHLNVLPPTVYTRVTDHMPQIISFIERIVQNGYGYTTSNGSVYFNIDVYTLSRYNRLASQDLEAEPEEGREVIDPEKRHPRDFALWKGVKPGEPSWDAPWGKGRPGWHIECSAMSSAIFGNRLDIHTGGRDLAFPHHNNEIAQCEACFNSNRWANYFLHSGHLFLKHDDKKMSKSLKNVVSISEFLNSYSSNHFRLLCLMSRYRYDIEYGPDTMQQVVAIHRQISSFINDADAYLKGQISCQPFDEASLMQRLSVTQQEVIEGFADDFDTKRALDAIMKLVHAGNAQFSQPSDMSTARSPGSVAAVSTYVSHVLTALGLQLTTRSSNLSSKVTTSTLDTLVGFRQDVRNWALNVGEDDRMYDTKNVNQDKSMDEKQRRKRLMTERAPLLKACDLVRESLAQHGIQIKDRSGSATWEIVDSKKSRECEDLDQR